MNFGDALQALKDGRAVRRGVWPPGMSLVMVPGSTIQVAADRPLGAALPHLVGRRVHYQPHIDLLLPNGAMGSWNAPDADMQGEDWAVHRP